MVALSMKMFRNLRGLAVPCSSLLSNGKVDNGSKTPDGLMQKSNPSFLENKMNSELSKVSHAIQKEIEVRQQRIEEQNNLCLTNSELIDSGMIDGLKLALKYISAVDGSNDYSKGM